MFDDQPLFGTGCEIWVARAAEFTDHQAALDLVLTPDERAHVAGVKGAAAPTARLSRALLRLVLARGLDVDPAEIEIERSCSFCGRPHGRPRLRSVPHQRAVELSVSHGGQLLVLAFADTGPLGVDVEPIDPHQDFDPELVAFTLTPAERQRLAEVPRQRRSRNFLQHWTGKEAVLKALGSGLDVDLQAVTLPTSEYPGRASVTRPGRAAVDLWVCDVDVGPAHVCTLATGREIADLRLVDLSPDLILGRAG